MVIVEVICELEFDCALLIGWEGRWFDEMFVEFECCFEEIGLYVGFVG